MEFQHKQLDNGLTVIGEINKSAQTTAVGFFVRTGSRDENDKINGVSHFLEHMMFKGTEKLSALEVNEAFDRIGAKFNAFTSEENTVYYAAVLPEYLMEVTELWMQLMRPSLRDDDFNMEKNVIKEEIAMYKDLPQFDVMDQCRALHFKGHPCGQSVIGTNESIDALSAAQMREYFTDRYAPNNMVLACCGNADFDAVSAMAQNKCGTWKTSKATRAKSFCSGSKEKTRKTKASLVREHICLLSPCVSMQDERKFAASLLSTIVGDFTGSRYFWAMVDTAIAENAAMQFESMDEVGALYSYIRTSPENAEKVIEIVNQIFEDLRKNGVTEQELIKSRNKILSAVTIRSETPMGRLVNLGFNWVYKDEYRSVDMDVASIKAVTVDQVNDLISEFQPGSYTQFSMGPEPE